jgi:phosphopantetheinyl transferase
MYVYFIDTDYFINNGYISKISEYIKEKLPECLLMRISDTKNEKRRNERILSYYLFSLALKDLNIEIPEIEFSENGKPYATDKSLSFSISHTDGLAAVAICEGMSDVGIDA